MEGGVIPKGCILLILLYFYVLKCNNWVSGVSNRRITVNSGIFTMNPMLISLHRRVVFRQPRFTLNSFTSDFGLSLVDLSVAIHIFRNKYPSAVDNHFICSLLDQNFCAVQKKKKKKREKHFKIQHEFSGRCSKHRIYTLPGGVVG